MWRSLIRNERGQAMVEMCIVLVLLLMLLFGITEFGRIFYYNLAIGNGARAGVRWSAVHTTWDAYYDTNLKIRVAYTTFPSSTYPADVASLTTQQAVVYNNTTITYYNASNTIVTQPTTGGDVMIRARYSVPIYAPLISKFTGNPHWVTGTMRMRVE